MEIVRTEEGTYTRTMTLKINEDLVEAINANLEAATVDGTIHEPLTLEEVWNIIKGTSARSQEEYFVELRFYTGNMKLYDFIRCEINNYFEEMQESEVEEKPDFWCDELHE